jgi:hypothetical protein
MTTNMNQSTELHPRFAVQRWALILPHHQPHPVSVDASLSRLCLSPHPGSRPNPNTKTKLANTTIAALGFALALLLPVVANAASTVTFDNKSGKPALVKLTGPTSTSVEVQNGEKGTVSASAGHYFIKIRYGTPGAYSYSKGDEFDVKETATTASDITITLHKVVAGNFGSKSISAPEFGADERDEKVEEKRAREEDSALPHSAGQTIVPTEQESRTPDIEP